MDEEVRYVPEARIDPTDQNVYVLLGIAEVAGSHLRISDVFGGHESTVPIALWRTWRKVEDGYVKTV